MGSTHVSTLQASAAQAGLLVQYADVSDAVGGNADANVHDMYRVLLLHTISDFLMQLC